jgi:hypothetical protein
LERRAAAPTEASADVIAAFEYDDLSRVVCFLEPPRAVDAGHAAADDCDVDSFVSHVRSSSEDDRDVRWSLAAGFAASAMRFADFVAGATVFDDSSGSCTRATTYYSKTGIARGWQKPCLSVHGVIASNGSIPVSPTSSTSVFRSVSDLVNLIDPEGDGAWSTWVNFYKYTHKPVLMCFNRTEHAKRLESMRATMK